MPLELKQAKKIHGQKSETLNYFWGLGFGSSTSTNFLIGFKFLMGYNNIALEREIALNHYDH